MTRKIAFLFLMTLLFTSVRLAIAADAVEYTPVGITADKQSFEYKVKVTTDKPITQVDIGAKYLDAKGGTIVETTLAWQNVVNSKKEPIANGKTYDVKDTLMPDSAKVESKLLRVHFADGTTWEAPAK